MADQILQRHGTPTFGDLVLCDLVLRAATAASANRGRGPNTAKDKCL